MGRALESGTRKRVWEGDWEGARQSRGRDDIACMHESLEKDMAMRKSSGMHRGGYEWRGDYEERDKSGSGKTGPHTHIIVDVVIP